MHSANLKNQVCLLYIRTPRLEGLDLLTKILLLGPFEQNSNQALMTMPVLFWPDVPFFNTLVLTCDTIELGLYSCVYLLPQDDLHTNLSPCHKLSPSRMLLALTMEEALSLLV